MEEAILETQLELLRTLVKDASIHVSSIPIRKLNVGTLAVWVNVSHLA